MNFNSNQASYHYGDVIDLTNNEIARLYLKSGWSDLATNDNWTVDNDAIVKFVLIEEPVDSVLSFNCLAFLGGGRISHQVVKVFINDQNIGAVNVSSDFQNYEIKIDAKVISQHEIEIRFHVDNPMSPTECNLYNDNRKLGIRVTHVIFSASERNLINDVLHSSEKNLLGIINQIHLNKIAKEITASSVDAIDINIIRQISKIKEAKRNRLRNYDGKYLIYLSSTFRSIDVSNICMHSNIEFLHRKPDSYVPSEPPELSKIYILNNNACNFTFGLQDYIKFYIDHPDDIFVIWDYDNHHWLSLSMNLSLYSDVYIPAHPHNLTLLATLAGHDLQCISCGTEQFTKKLIANKLENMVTRKRCMEPLGFHNYYERFSSRNHIISLFQQIYSSCGFPISPYNANHPEENIEQWIDHSCSLVSPVYGDLPIRVFDALITGGIPIVPFYLENTLLNLGVSPDFFVTYSMSELDEPDKIVLKANDLFVKKGESGVIERVNYAMQNHHIHSRLMDIFEIINRHLLIKK